MYEILDRQPKIYNAKNPIKLLDFNGEIVLKDIKFNYPNRPD